MATNWVLDKISNALAPTVSGAVSSAGSFAGGAVNAVGNSINGVGEGINNSIRRYGDGTRDYGNAIMDWTKAEGVRGATASNPLGLSSGATGGKRQVTSPEVYRAPTKPSASKTLTTTSKTAAPQKKKTERGTPTKALPAPAKKNASTAPLKSAPAQAKIGSAPNPGAMRKKPADTSKAAPASAPKQATSVKKAGPVKASTASAPKTSTRPKTQGNYTAAANPLGLSS